jgi:hypothetical protein
MHNWSAKFVCALGVVGSLLISSCGSDEPKPNTPTIPTPINVSVSEAGAPNYNLRDAYVESATYDAKISSVSISGKLANGKLLSLAFKRQPNSSSSIYMTDQLVSTLDGVAATQSTGSSSYSAQTKTVDGNFTVSFPSTGVITGSFINAATP